ncbi:MAG TPA: mechanosensitive ion channel domain-containing protein [Candidatus Xenobia bacterium]
MDWLTQPIGDLAGHVVLMGPAVLAILLIAGVILVAGRISRALGRVLDPHIPAANRRALHRLVEFGLFLGAVLPACRMVGLEVDRPVIVFHGDAWTVVTLVAFFFQVVAAFVVSRVAQRIIVSPRVSLTWLSERQRERLGGLVRTLIWVFGLIEAFATLGFTTTAPATSLGNVHVSPFSVIVFLATLATVVVGSDLLGTVVGRHLLSGGDMDPGTQYAVGQLTNYVALFVGLLVALETVGVQLSSLTVMLGALSVGVGFGLQGIVNNFISGLVVLLERPIQVGDVIEVDGVRGRVRRIQARATTLLTSDNTTIIVPNADLVTKRITNWTHDDPTVRIKMPLLVDMDVDLEGLERLIFTEVKQSHWVLDTPAPSVSVTDLATDGLHLEIGVSVNAATEGFTAARGDLLRRLWTAFRREGIRLPGGEQVVILKQDGGVPKTSVPEKEQA